MKFLPVILTSGYHSLTGALGSFPKYVRNIVAASPFRRRFISRNLRKALDILGISRCVVIYHGHSYFVM
jgi:hypothetical protein